MPGCSDRAASTCGGAEALVHRAVTLPEEQRGVLDVALLEAAALLVRVPDPHVGLAVAHREAGVAAEVLVGKEQHLVALGEGPLEHRSGVRRGADRAAVASDERLQRSRRVHVRDGHDAVDVGDGGHLVPGLFDLVEMGHVGHGAARVEVGEDDPLVGAGEHVGRLGHEVDAAEDDVGGEVVVGGEAGEEERVPDHVGPANHLVALVVVTEDHQTLTERVFGGGNPIDEVILGREGVFVRERSLESQHVGPPRCGVTPLRPAGGSPVASTAGLSASELRVGCAGYRAGVPSP